MEGMANEYGGVAAAQMGAGLGIVWGLQKLVSMRLKVNISACVLLIFCVWMVATFVWSKNPDASMKLALSYFMAFVFYVIVFDLTVERNDVLILITSYVSGVAVLSATAVYNIASSSTYSGLYNRYSAVGTDPNNFGMMLALTIPLLYVMWRSYDGKVKWLIIGALMIFSLLIVSTASRAANISLFAMIAVFLFRNESIKSILGSFLVFFALLFTFYLLLFTYIPAESYERLIDSLAVVGSDGRFDIWADALNARNISLFGAGSGSSIYHFGVQTHNTFISVLFEGGIFGLLIWLLFWATHGIYLIGALQTDRSLDSWFFMVSYFVLLIASSTLNWEFRKPLYFFMAIYAAWYSILKREKSKKYKKISN